MAIGTEFLIDYPNKRIYHDNGSTIYTVLELYTHIMDTFDELTQMDDSIPMSAQTPTEFTLINGWFIDEPSLEYLKGGAIKTDGYNGQIQILTFASGGYVSAVAGDIGKTVSGNTESGTLLAYNNTLRKWWVRSTFTYDNGESVTIGSGTGAGTLNADSTSGENLYSNIYTIGSIESGTNIYVAQGGTKLTSWWSSGHIDVLIKVKEAGVVIASGVVTVFARELSDLYDHFQSDLSNGGRTAIPLATSNDLNNQTAEGTIAGYNNITITFGTVSKTLGGVTKDYDVTIDCSGRTLAQVYEYLKYVTRRTSVMSLNGTDGEQYRSANFPTYTESKASPFGTFAGGTFFGARGVWIEDMHSDNIKSYQLISADNTTVYPPNTVVVKVTGVVNGDRVAVFELTGVGGTINKAKYNSAAGNDLGDGTLVIQEAIEADTPQSGVVRILDDRYAYTSWTGSTVTLSGTLSTSYTLGDDVYVPFIDTQATGTSVETTLVQSTDIPVLIRVRKKGIIPFEIESTIGSTGMNVSAIRTTDSIVQ